MQRSDDAGQPRSPRRLRAKPLVKGEPARFVDDVRVISEVPVLSNLPSKVPIGITILTLENGMQVFGCRDCSHTGATRGLLMTHRSEEHGTGSFGNSRENRNRVARARAADDENYIKVPKSAGTLSFAEIAEMAAQAEHWSTVVRGLNDSIDELRRQLASVTNKLRHAERRIANVDDWKQRAVRAEGQLAAIEAAIEKIGYTKKGTT